jgi:hypothetical protein
VRMAVAWRSAPRRAWATGRDMDIQVGIYCVWDMPNVWDNCQLFAG